MLFFFLMTYVIWIRNEGKPDTGRTSLSNCIYEYSNTLQYICDESGRAVKWDTGDYVINPVDLTYTTGYYCDWIYCSRNYGEYGGNSRYIYLSNSSGYYYWCQGAKAPLLTPSPEPTPEPTPQSTPEPTPQPTPQPTSDVCPLQYKLVWVTPQERKSKMSIINPYLFFIFE